MKAIRHPFSLGSLGKINTTEDSNKVYTDRVLTLLSTLSFGRPMSANYGVDMTRALYENGNEFERAVTEAITRALSTYLPVLRIQRIRFTQPNSSGEASVDIQLDYPDGTAGTFTIGANEFLNDGTIAGDIY